MNDNLTEEEKKTLLRVASQDIETLFELVTEFESNAKEAERKRIMVAIQYAVEDEATIERIKNGIEALSTPQHELLDKTEEGE